MMRLARFVMLLVCLAPAAYANANPNDSKPASDSALCKSVCAAARQDCRAKAQHETEGDTNPVLSMNTNTNPSAAAVKEVIPQSQQLRPSEAQAFRARRAERLQSCEVQYRRCTSACG